MVGEHAWKEHHPIRWQETNVIDRASRFGELRVKEALHIHLTPEDQRFNRDVGLELPENPTYFLKIIIHTTTTTNDQGALSCTLSCICHEVLQDRCRK